MSLTFANFKQVISAQILSRGRDYVRYGNILDLTFDDEELLWEAQVEGSDVYDVRVEQSADGSLACSCTCPYDMGDYCKHIAAVLYAIEAAFPDQIEATPRRKAAKRQTRHDKLRLRLEKVTREELVAVLLDLTQQDRELLNQLLIHLDTGEVKPMDYRRVVKDALRAGRGDHGYLDYTGSNRAGGKIMELLTQARRWLEAGEIDKAVGVYQAVIDETIPAIAQSDDSSGALGGCIATAIEGLSESVALYDKAGREALFSYLLERARSLEFAGWDWEYDLLGIAEGMVDNPARRAAFMSALEDIEAHIRKPGPTGFINDYSLAQIAQFKLSIVERLDGAAAARAFLHAHSHLDPLRMMLIERCMAEGALDEAMGLIQEGITASEERQRPGLTNQYQALRVKLLQTTGDKTALIDAARTLWLDRGGEDVFDLLKQTVPAAEWPAFVGGLIEASGRKPDQLAWLYARESRWRDLMTLVQSNQQAAWLLETYREPLETRFADEVAALYEKSVTSIVASASGRDHYRKAVAYLRRIKQIGKPELAAAIANRIKQQYANRPALLDELSRA